VVKKVQKNLKYTDTDAFKEQKVLLNKLEHIYYNKDNDASKKIMLFTSEVCIPEIMKQQEAAMHLNKTARNKTDEEGLIQIENDQDKPVIPMVCFFNALSFLKRLPTLDEINEKNKAIDIERGFKMKDAFVELRKQN